MYQGCLVHFVNNANYTSLIDLFSLYALFPQLGYVITPLFLFLFFSNFALFTEYLRIIYEKTKGQGPLGLLLGKQNIQAKEVYSLWNLRNHSVHVNQIRASCLRNILSPEHNIKCYKQQKWTFNNYYANNFFKKPQLQSFSFFSSFSILAFFYICCVICTFFFSHEELFFST